MKTYVLPVLVGFGDCDPAGIVFYPNFFRWFDLATHQMMHGSGYDIVRVRREQGLIVGPLVDVGATFRSPATHGETIEIHSTVSEWTSKTFRIAHQVRRAGTVLADGFELRIFARPDPDDPSRIRAVAIPEDFRLMFG